MVTDYTDICIICGKPKQETHHLIFGRGLRELADSDKLTAPLCASCHKQIHLNGMSASLSKMLGQMQWERDFIMSQADEDTQAELNRYARDEFRKRYGRSYL